MRTPTVADCAYCLDGLMPSGQHPELGPVYVRCPFCLFNGAIPGCQECGDNAYYPAAPACWHCLLEELAERGLTAAICPTCFGITYTYALPGGEGRL